MPFTRDQVTANRNYFVEKLRAEKQRSDVLHAAESGVYDFTLLDTRPREAFESGHIPGAWCAPFDQLGEVG